MQLKPAPKQKDDVRIVAIDNRKILKNDERELRRIGNTANYLQRYFGQGEDFGVGSFVSCAKMSEKGELGGDIRNRLQVTVAFEGKEIIGASSTIYLVSEKDAFLFIGYILSPPRPERMGVGGCFSAIPSDSQDQRPQKTAFRSILS